MPVPAGSGSAVPLADVKAHLNITTSTHDAELTTMLEAAEARLAHEVGPLTVASFTEVHDGGGSELLLRKTPVQALTSITYTDDTTVTLSDVSVDTVGGVVYWRNGPSRFSWGRYGVTVVYTAGRTTLPADLRQAVLELTRHLWETQRGAAPARPGVAAEDPSLFGTAYTLPNRVKEMIQPYRAAVGV